MKLFEYMASRRPIVASRTAAIRQIVSSDEVFFYEPDNAADLAEKIKYASQDRSQIRAKTEKAYRKVRDYSWDRRARRVLEFLDLNVKC
jgi:glycosyltransferase involved in cell wall biosynthesis